MSRAILVVLLLMLATFSVSAQDSLTPTPETFDYIIRANDTLSAIAFRNGTTVGALMRLNNLQNAEMIVIGQRLRIPLPASAQPTTPAETPIPVIPIAPSSPAAPTFDYGIAAFFEGQDLATVISQINGLGMHWAKVRVSWRNMEPHAGAIDFTQLDPIIDALEASRLNVLLTITNAPDWARSSALENGPPDDLSDYAAFVGTLASRYAGRVRAYEIWHEPNLRREWNSGVHPVSADSYAELLRGAFTAIKAADSGAVVVSAGLAPTGFDDGINARDDRKYLERLYELGLPQFSDAVGAHPFGFANPPEATCCEPAQGVQSHYAHPSFFFRDTLNDYRAIMLSNNDGARQIWVTEFGWGTSEDIGAAPENSSYVGDNSLAEQAAYLTRAFELGANTGFVGVMIAYNLNGCTAPNNIDACFYSLIGPGGQARPAYNTLSMIFAPAIAG